MALTARTGSVAELGFGAGTAARGDDLNGDRPDCSRWGNCRYLLIRDHREVGRQRAEVDLGGAGQVAAVIVTVVPPEVGPDAGVMALMLGPLR